MIFARALLVLWICTVPGLTREAGVQGSSHLDPLYQNDASPTDTSDAHTVTASQQDSSYSKFKQLLERKNGVSGLQQLPPAIDEDNSLSQYRGSSTGSTTKTTPSDNILSYSTPFVLSPSNTAKRQVVSSGPFDADYLTSLSAATPAAPLLVTSKQTEPPKHWSAIDNYYQKMKQETLSKQWQGGLLKPEQQTVLGSLIQEALNDHTHDGKLFQHQRPQPIYHGFQAPSQGSNVPPPSYYDKSRPEFLSPIKSADRPPFLSQIASALPSFSSQGQLSSQSVNSANSWSPTSPPPPYSLNSAVGQQPRQAFELDQTIEQQPIIIQPSLQQGPGRDYSSLIQQLRQTSPELKPVPIIQQEQIDWPTGANYDDYASARYRSQLELRKLPDSLIFQQQQARIRHQQETFGPWYDQQRSQEQLQEEAYCGPRNYVNYQLGGSAPLREPIDLSKVNRALLSEDNLKQLLQSQTPVPVSLSAGEYPSHMGLYNGTTVGDDNFICGATWVNERFALTLASCIWNNDSMQHKNATLTIRAGEWNLGRQKGNKTPLDGDKLAATMVTRQVGRVHMFPRYEPGSGEHNLALVEWAKPIDFLEVPYICPACQAQLRNSLQTSSCWTPIRTVSFSEYFDAEGEGETKLKRTVSMTEVPVKLYANRESECKAKTGLEYFNFQHPNYICSGDVKQAQWRAKLNQTDHFGSGIYCNEGGVLNLVSILHPIRLANSSAYGYLDLSYYKPWMRNVISGKAY